MCYYSFLLKCPSLLFQNITWSVALASRCHRTWKSNCWTTKRGSTGKTSEVLGRGDNVEGIRRGGCAPRSIPLPFYIPMHFWQHWYPFRIPSTDKWYRFHIPSLELCIPLNCYKCTVYNVLINHNKLFHSHKIKPSLALLGRFTPRWQIALPFHIYFNWWSPFIYMKHKKGPPFGRSLPVKSTLREYPPPGY